MLTFFSFLFLRHIPSFSPDATFNVKATSLSLPGQTINESEEFRETWSFVVRFFVGYLVERRKRCAHPICNKHTEL